ncbi:MAG: hypothetical protein EBS19_15650, partial [Spirochaetia bacterium]|nr:hypothetical protein [Spirochaetia bacterium]
MEKISLENMGEYDETWLKLRIIENPKILGLGKLNLLSREKIIKDVGIIDLIMESSDGKNIFVIEAMVGEIDESHIIRSILYWINESREVRMKNFYPILIAESFNNRFFEVLYFLTNYIPFIIVQVTALALDEIDSEGNRKLELVFTDVPIKGSKSFRER